MINGVSLFLEGGFFVFVGNGNVDGWEEREQPSVPVSGENVSGW
ncbi:hypothetical protein [Robertmurraya korlensis]|nr:hypothetical protein [Robertmurraya korlensis]